MSALARPSRPIDDHATEAETVQDLRMDVRALRGELAQLRSSKLLTNPVLTVGVGVLLGWGMVAAIAVPLAVVWLLVR